MSRTGGNDGPYKPCRNNEDAVVRRLPHGEKRREWTGLLDLPQIVMLQMNKNQDEVTKN
jgi:hypothetical protein